MEHDEERRRVAAHESGHVVMAFELRVPLGLVSIRPGAHFLGVAFHGATRLRKGDGLKLTSPVLQPASLRRRVETSVMVALAGDIAERYYGPRWSGFVPTKTDDAMEAERLASILSEMPPTDQEAARLGKYERGEPIHSDETKARELSDVLSFTGTGPLFLGWLRAETEHLLSRPYVGRMVDALSEALLDREVVGAKASRTILKEARDGRSYP